ncbi:MAG: hypothetical protein KJN68_02085, partial [Bacteroidia bacterium]|nr:hypothetical protein [Bacteroidia bacterium]
REIDRPVNEKTVKIPLQSLSFGKHVFAVSYFQKKIVFVVRVHDPNSTYLTTRRTTEVATNN